MPIAILLLIKIIWFSRYGILYSCKEVTWLMEGFKVSVVVPTFNRVDFVLDAIKSISSQTFQPLEIILVIITLRITPRKWLLSTLVCKDFNPEKAGRKCSQKCWNTRGIR